MTTPEELRALELLFKGNMEYCRTIKVPCFFFGHLNDRALVACGGDPNTTLVHVMKALAETIAKSMADCNCPRCASLVDAAIEMDEAASFALNIDAIIVGEGDA